MNDDLSIFLGDGYEVGGFKVKNPKIEDIIEYGEDNYISAINIFTLKPSDMMVQLYDDGIDYQEIDKFNKLADEMNLICTYNLNSKEDTQKLRIKYIEEVTPLKSEREKLRQLYRKSTNETDRSFLEYKINNITKDIDKINSKIQTCKRIIATAEKGEKENFLIKKRVEDNRLKSKKEIAKNKDKKRIR